jgi:hypothetical protein
MPYHITWESRGLVATFTGPCSVKDVLHAYEAIGKDRRFDELRYQIFDYLGAHPEGVDVSDLDHLAGLHFAHSLTNPTLLYASVAVDPVVIELIKHYININTKPESQRHCETVAQARDWIQSRLR